MATTRETGSTPKLAVRRALLAAALIAPLTGGAIVVTERELPVMLAPLTGAVVGTLYGPLRAECRWRVLTRWRRWVVGCQIAAFVAPLLTAALLESGMAFAVASGATVLVAAIFKLEVIRREIGRTPGHSEARAEAIWRDLEALASTPLPSPRLHRRAARLARLALMIALPILFSGVEHAGLREAGALSLVPFAVYILILYKDFAGRVDLAHVLLSVAAIVVAIGLPRVTDGNAYLTQAATAPLLIAAVVMGERARRRWDRTGAQTEADLRAILHRRRESRAAESPGQPL